MKLDSVGIGLSLIPSLRKEFLNYRDEIDFVEFYTESMFYQEWDDSIQHLLSQKPYVFHGLDLSLGSKDPLDSEYMEKLQGTLERYSPKWFSDHICMTKIQGEEVGHLMPIEFNEETLELVVSKIENVQSLKRIPFLVENITYYYQLPFSTYSEAEFLTKVCEKTDCGLLLDLNNLYINSQNLCYDPITYLNSIPLDRVVEVHLAGGSFKKGMLVDTHANSIDPEVWKLLEVLSSRADIKGVVIERDANIPQMTDLVAELRRARAITGIKKC